jgi:nickel/cobalt transporter (NicO) family protein
MLPDIAELIRTGSTLPWVYLPLALLLGALHGLEPGHSKSMMAAFVVAIKGTIPQAMLLGLSAAIAHSFTVGCLALLGLYLGPDIISERSEPWLLLISGIIVIAMSAWMLRNILGHHHDQHEHEHHDHHDHDHHDDHHDHGSEDAHAAAHARDIAKKFSSGHATTAQIIGFGITGGLMPCPSAIAVLLVSIQLKAFTLGAAMVLAFSIGLACTLVAVGALAAWGVAHAHKHMDHSSPFFAAMPALSSSLMIILGLIMIARGFMTLA